MKFKKVVFALLIISLSNLVSAKGFYIESNPAAFLFDGYNIGFMYKIGNKWSIGGLYSSIAGEVSGRDFRIKDGGIRLQYMPNGNSTSSPFYATTFRRSFANASFEGSDYSCDEYTEGGSLAGMGGYRFVSNSGLTSSLAFGYLIGGYNTIEADCTNSIDWSISVDTISGSLLEFTFGYSF